MSLEENGKWTFDGWHWDGAEGYYHNGMPVSQEEYFQAVKDHSDEPVTEKILVPLLSEVDIRKDEWTWGDDGKFYHNGVEVTPIEFFYGNREGLPPVTPRRVWEFGDLEIIEIEPDEDDERFDPVSLGQHPPLPQGWIEVDAVEDMPRRSGTLGAIVLILFVILAVVIGLIIYWPRY